MNEQIIQEIFYLKAQFEEKRKSVGENSLFVSFQIEYETYFIPLMEQVIPQIIDHIKVVRRENLNMYAVYIGIKWMPLVKHFLLRKKEHSVKNHTLCEYMVKDLNLYLTAYEYKDDNQHKSRFIDTFIKSKKKNLIAILKEDFELFLSTTAQLKCPKIQFELINKPIEVKNIMKKQFQYCSEYEKMYFIYKYFTFPKSIYVDDYYQQWIGESFLHVKFFRDILSDYYIDAKMFLKSNPDR